MSGPDLRVTPIDQSWPSWIKLFDEKGLRYKHDSIYMQMHVKIGVGGENPYRSRDKEIFFVRKNWCLLKAAIKRIKIG